VPVIALIVVGAFLILGTGCTQEQLDHWLAWRQTDPVAADEWVHSLEDDLPTPGDCESYWPLMQSYGLPRVFVRVAWRESACDHRRFTDDRDDLGGFLFGLNFRTANLRSGWLRWCGATLSTIRYDPELQVRCAAVAYQKLGMAPWRT
jgi:hypothetical protein